MDSDAGDFNTPISVAYGRDLPVSATSHRPLATVRSRCLRYEGGSASALMMALPGRPVRYESGRKTTRAAQSPLSLLSTMSKSSSSAVPSRATVER